MRSTESAGTADFIGTESSGIFTVRRDLRRAAAIGSLDGEDDGAFGSSRNAGIAGGGPGVAQPDSVSSSPGTLGGVDTRDRAEGGENAEDDGETSVVGDVGAAGGGGAGAGAAMKASIPGTRGMGAGGGIGPDGGATDAPGNVGFRDGGAAPEGRGRGTAGGGVSRDAPGSGSSLSRVTGGTDGADSREVSSLIEQPHRRAALPCERRAKTDGARWA